VTGEAEKSPLASYSLESLANVLERAGFRRFRAEQIANWYYDKCVHEWSEMANLPAGLLRWLDENLLLASSALAQVHDSGDGAQKLEIRLADGETVEAVLIRSARRLTLCLSSQVGCPLCCAFCATGAGGFSRNLAAWEIVEQAVHACRVAGERVTNAVFMGMGEPCLNIDAVFDATRRLNASYAFRIGARRITISTLGDPDCIDRIAEFPLDVSLAVSLHAGDEKLRRRLVPAAPAHIEETIEAASRYFKRTGREVTYEYVLLAGENDSPDHARVLGRLLKGRRAFVNLIAYNEVEGLAFRRPSAEAVERFRSTLAATGVRAHVRRSRGRKARAACGQLRLHGGKGRASPRPHSGPPGNPRARGQNAPARGETAPARAEDKTRGQTAPGRAEDKTRGQTAPGRAEDEARGRRSGPRGGRRGPRAGLRGSREGPRGERGGPLSRDGDIQDYETRLMVRFAGGNDSAFDEIVERFQGRVFGIIHRYIGNSEYAADCAQEVFLRLYRMRRSYRPEARLSTLIYRITANLCLNYIRDSRKHRTLSLDFAREDAPSIDLPAPGEATDVSAGMERREKARIVRAALDEIPPRQRVALVLHRFEGLSYKEIAEAMEINVAAVKSLLNRARNSLADRLQSEIENGNI